MRAKIHHKRIDLGDLTILRSVNSQFLQRRICFSKRMFSPCGFPGAPGRNEGDLRCHHHVVSHPLCWASRARQKVRRSSASSDACDPCAPGTDPWTTSKYSESECNRNMSKRAVKMSSDPWSSVFSKLTTELSLWISRRRHFARSQYISISEPLSALTVVADDGDCFYYYRFTINQLWGLILSKLSRFRFIGRLRTKCINWCIRVAIQRRVTSIKH